MTDLSAMDDLAALCAAAVAARALRDAPPAVRLAAVASGALDEFMELGRGSAAKLVRDVRTSRDYSVETHGETDEQIAAWVLARVEARRNAKAPESNP